MMPISQQGTGFPVIKLRLGSDCKRKPGLLLRARVPYFHGLIQPGGGNPPAIRAKCHTIDTRSMALEHDGYLATGCIPHPYFVIFASRSQTFTVRAENNTFDICIRIVMGRKDLLAAFQIPDLYRTI